MYILLTYPLESIATGVFRTLETGPPHKASRIEEYYLPNQDLNSTT